MNDIILLKNLSEEIGINLSDKQLEQFNKYYEVLVEWNSFMNLTAITDFDEVILKHFIDSIELVKASDNEIVSKIISGEEVSLIDVGTGAGFPSLPLKIVFPNLKVTMLDSLNKRIKFLNQVITDLNLTDITAVHGRAEDFAANKNNRESFDIAVSRAVANLSTLSEYCLPFVKEGGYFIAYKSEELLNKKILSDDELSKLDHNDIKYLLTQKSEKEASLKAVEILGGRFEFFYEYTLPGSDIYRVLGAIKKIKKSPLKYPRKAGLPSKEPII